MTAYPDLRRHKMPWIAVFVLLAISSAPAHSDSINRHDIYLVSWQGQALKAPVPVAAINPTPVEPRRRPIQLASLGNGHGLGDSNEAFNRAWLNSFKPEYSTYEGEKAGRKLVQFWAKRLWKQWGQHNRSIEYQATDYLIEHFDASNAYQPRYGKQRNHFDYRVSLSDDDVELKLHYTYY